MRFRIYILLAAAFLWFVFASVFMYRSAWDLDDAFYHRNALVEFGLKEDNSKYPPVTFAFKLQGMDRTMGIQRKKFASYDTFVRSMKIGDTITLYYENWKLSEGSINTQVVHMENEGRVLVDFKIRKRKDLLVAVILYILCSISLGFALLLRQKRMRIIRNSDTEFFGLGMYHMD